MYAQSHILLFGDSLTQLGYDPLTFSWVSALSHAYIRRLHIINLGLSGYSTDQALQILPSVLPPPSQANIRFLVVFFGANDARLPGTGAPEQHVPLEEFSRNLRAIVGCEGVREHVRVRMRLVMVTPTPVDEWVLRDIDSANGVLLQRRTAETTAKYAQLVREVSEELGVACLDVWSAFMGKVGWKEGEPLVGSLGAEHSVETGLPSLLCDGLHLTGEGNRVIFDALMKLIQEKWPDQVPEALPFALPTWVNENAWKEILEKRARVGLSGK